MVLMKSGHLFMAIENNDHLFYAIKTLEINTSA